MSAILYDARGNEIISSYPDQVNNGVMTDPRTLTSVLSALNAEVIMDLAGSAVASFDLRSAAGALTVVFEGTIDGTNYIQIPAFALAQLLAATFSSAIFVPSVVLVTTANAQYLVSVSGFKRVRARVSAFTSGTVTIAARATAADFLINNNPVPSSLHITATGVANAAATATLPAPGAGMFHYITHISCMRNATAALAGTATLLITTSNLPGNPVWSTGNAMVAGGTQVDVNYTPTTPLKSLVANTATTVVMPAAGAAVLNRVNVSYYISQ